MLEANALCFSIMAAIVFPMEDISSLAQFFSKTSGDIFASSMVFSFSNSFEIGLITAK